ncbi:mediator of RNA polymerase II transcription subunit 8 [Didymosphaeria variabile]|uniref:Mediator of RNA polymerase II transcription subunit 8 n=1 Tax=Didymosphaeria variabile TaxID=1932322 RepID=A0A9W8XRG5_9PLEO|nr:mediator of RNA polymerase II transcription subunit 8 [Didymosphaeria variabile]KAJ4357526.1 mediator of RNA polymerase II transcription subunit 8 [Didymosphaeria variabile]
MASNTNQVMPGEPAKADVALLESLRTRLMSLVWILEQMKKELIANQTAPPDWPSIQRSIAAVSSTITSIQSFINKDPETLSTFRALHSFPIPPFPTADPQLGPLIDTIFSKEPGTKEKDWILAKLTKAAEFAHVPGDWGIEAKRPAQEDDEKMDEGEEGRAKLRRVKADLDEDQLAALWKDVYDIAEEAADDATNQQEQGGESGDEEDEDMEDVVGTETGSPAQDAVVEQKKAKEEQPMMSLDTIHRFTSTGSTFR